MLTAVSKTTRHRTRKTWIPFALLSVIAFAGLGLTGCSGVVSGSRTDSPPSNTTPPTVSITAPANGATVSGTITISATASDNVGVASVQFQLDGANLGNLNMTAPYSLSWNTATASNGSHALRAIAKDAAGNSTTSAAVSVTVGNGIPQQAPVISGVASGAITITSSIVNWATDVGATSQVKYGTSTAYGQSTPLDSTLVLSHSQTLAGLSPNTTYQYQVQSTGANNVTAVSGNFSFTTAARTTPPVISNIGSAPDVTTATITWITDEPADSQVQYGTTSAYGQISALDSILSTGHSVILSGLIASTTYHFEVVSRDSSGNLAVSTDQTLTTSAPGTGIPSGIGWHDLGGLTQLQGSTRDICPPNNFGGDPYLFDANCKNVTHAWSGGILDQKRQRMILFGGGHNDYYGNEVYALNLNASPVIMVRLNNPTVPTNQNTANVIDAIPIGCTPQLNCFPNSRHSYQGLNYLPTSDQMVVWGGGCAGQAGGFCQNPSTWLLDMGTLTWHQKGASGLIGGSEPISDYDPNTDRMWIHDGSQGSNSTFSYYNYATSSYVQVNGNASAVANGPMGVVDYTNKKFVEVGGSSFVWFDISGNDPAYTMHTQAVDASCSAITGFSGVAYDPVGKQIVVWPNGGNSVILLNDTTWICTTSTFSNGPGSGEADGTMGRFRYVQAQDAFILVPTYSSDAFGLRLR